MIGSSPQKKTLRAQLRQTMMEIPPAALARASAAACELLVATPEFQAASTVMIFLPLKHEIDTRTLALRAWQQQKIVTVPLVSYEQKHMIPVELRSLEESMNTDHYGVRTPQGAPHPIETIDLVVMPGLGFDRHGHRIGRGLGFYDRFLAQKNFAGSSCGIAMEQQVVEDIPITQHDMPLNMLVTDRQVLRFDV